MNIANVDMAAAWDGDEGTDWARDWEHYDLGVRSHHARLMDAAAISRAERVLDVGCGNGQTTRDAARSAAEGSALGVDLSSGMIARAREIARHEKLTNVTFDVADAQVHPFEPAGYDVAMSRFGAMFFGDPVAAFTNIAQALRPGAGSCCCRGSDSRTTSGSWPFAAHWPLVAPCQHHRSVFRGRSGSPTPTTSRRS
jgi:ubiquinone/menaquinone biosynthesis C-methylase UbiE